MQIDINIKNNGVITSNSKEIGFTNENKATKLVFNIPEDLSDRDFYLDIEKPDGSKFKTAKIDIINNKAECIITNSILSVYGFIRIQVIFQDNNNFVMKYPILQFKINNSIDATEEIEEEKPDFVSQTQAIIDLVEFDGSGTEFLSNDGTYKTLSSGSSDYDDLENKPMARSISMDNTNPTILRNLDSGLYELHGWFRPYESSEVLMAAQTPVLAAIAKSSDTSFIQLFFPFNNIIQYFEISNDNFTSKNISLNNLLSRIEALEENQ